MTLKKMIITAAFASTGAMASDFVSPQIESLGYPLDPAQKELIGLSLPETDRLERMQLNRVIEDLNHKLSQQEDGDREARVCVTRCKGTGADKVCWKVCVDNND